MPASFHHIRISGYLLSMASTCLLAVPALRNSDGHPLMLLMVVLGVILSLLGIGLRWHSHRAEQNDRDGQ
ncbi:MAG: hypothetical protein JSR96_06695 [Proteobacteria bacterium]|nr:hypothetical protein [Pseudomonadota bacterium]